MQNTEAACEEIEHAAKKIKMSRFSLPANEIQESNECASEQPTQFCIFTKLLELYQEECAKNSVEPIQGLRRKSYLLEKLVLRERLNTLILNLYPGNKGYSLAFRTLPRTHLDCENTANMIETKEWFYEDDELLRYIDNEELPPHLVDILQSHYSFLFYDECIIVEKRDYRQAFPLLKCDIHHVLLRPTSRSIWAEINNIMEDKEDWGTEERQLLESEFVMANNRYLCLDPDPKISLIQTTINNRRHLWNTNKFRRMARKFSQVTVNRKRKLDQFTYRPGLELYEYITRVRKAQDDRQDLDNEHLGNSIKFPKPKEVKPIPVPNLDPPLISPPTQGVVINEFKAYERPKECKDYLPQLIEEYVLETTMPNKDKTKPPRRYHIKLSILQRPCNSEYLGELYLDRDHKDNERNGVACTFTLGSRLQAMKYVQQFTEIFTENGRKPVKVRYGTTRGNRLAPSLVQASNMIQQVSQIEQPGPSQQQNSHQVVNGALSPGISIVQNQSFTNTSNVPILQSHLQGSSSTVKSTSQIDSNQEHAINVIAMSLMNCEQQFLAQLVTGMKTINQQGIRSSGPTTVSLSPGGQPFQIITPIQRPRMQQANLQQNSTSRTIQRSPITLKMAAPNSNPQATLLPNQLQKQAQVQYQQLLLNQQNIHGVAGKVRRRSNTSDHQ